MLFLFTLAFLIIIVLLYLLLQKLALNPRSHAHQQVAAGQGWQYRRLMQLPQVLCSQPYLSIEEGCLRSGHHGLYGNENGLDFWFCDVSWITSSIQTQTILIINARQHSQLHYVASRALLRDVFSPINPQQEINLLHKQHYCHPPELDAAISEALSSWLMTGLSIEYYQGTLLVFKNQHLLASEDLPAALEHGLRILQILESYHS